MEQKSLFARWRSSFLTGLVLVLPAVISFYRRRLPDGRGIISSL